MDLKLDGCEIHDIPKMKIRENYECYDEVKDAFHQFIHKLVWESSEIDEGFSRKEVNKHIDTLCNEIGDKIIANINKEVREYINNLSARYETHCYLVDKNGNIMENGQVHIRTNNERTALEYGANFWKNNNSSKVMVYDTNEEEYLMDLK